MRFIAAWTFLFSFSSFADPPEPSRWLYVSVPADSVVNSSSAALRFHMTDQEMARVVQHALQTQNQGVDPHAMTSNRPNLRLTSTEDPEWQITTHNYQVTELSSAFIRSERNKPRNPSLTDTSAHIGVQNGDTVVFGQLEVLQPSPGDTSALVQDTSDPTHWVKAWTAGIQEDLIDNHRTRLVVQAAYTINTLPAEMQSSGYGPISEGVAVGFVIQFK